VNPAGDAVIPECRRSHSAPSCIRTKPKHISSP